MGEERPGVLRRTSQIQDFINRTGGVLMKEKKTTPSCYLSCHQQSPFQKQTGQMQSIPVDEQTESCCIKT